MAKLGSFGSVIRFEVKEDKKVLQPLNVQQDIEARWSEQERFGQKPVAEFQGMNNEGITLEVKVSVFRGVNPSTTIRKIRSAISTGRLEYLILGGKRVCNSKCYIEKMTVTRNRTLKSGQLADADLSLTFREYT